MLAGKHLRVNELEWYPYAFKDDTSPHGWNGFDIDLLRRLSRQLGFTFEVHEESKLTSEPRWTDTLIRTVEEVDLWASWWMRDTERMNYTVMLSGHVDVSAALVHPPLAPASSALFTGLYAPFSPYLWLAIIALVLLSGTVDFLLERGNGGTITSSLYEYCGGVLWGGFQDPHTRTSAVYQILNAFVMMVIVAAYTANLASTMTNSGKPVPRFGSVDDIIGQKMAACADPSYAQQATLESMFGTLNFKDVGGQGEIAQALLDGTCTAAIAPRNDFDTWATQGGFCELSMVGPSLVFATAGWVTSTKAAPCIQRPLELAIHLLQASGELQQMYSDWIPVAACTQDADETDETASTTRRRLRKSGPGRSHHRRLKGGGGGGGTVAASSSGGGTDEAQMGVEDFTGLFVLWLSGTALALLATAGKAVLARRRRAHDGSVGDSSSRQAHNNTQEMTTAEEPHTKTKLPPKPVLDTVRFGRNADATTPHFDPNLDINDNSAMLRYLIMLADESRQEEVRTAGKVHELWDQLVHTKKSMEA